MKADHDANVAAIRADMVALANDHRPFRRAYEVGGHTPVVLRAPGFPCLIKLILEQQVSLAAAARMFEKLNKACTPLEPERFLTLNDPLLRECGFSRQKIVYARGLANAIRNGEIDLHRIGDLTDEDAIETLCRLKGIGPWTAQNYLLWSFGRRDIFPANDLALMIGWHWLAQLDNRPSAAELTEVAQAWQPRRTAAAFLIWHFYLAEIDNRRRAR